MTNEQLKEATNVALTVIVSFILECNTPEDKIHAKNLTVTDFFKRHEEWLSEKAITEEHCRIILKEASNGHPFLTEVATDTYFVSWAIDEAMIIVHNRHKLKR
jgi:hypothetical protein